MPISANIMKLSLSIMLILRSSVGKENHAQVNNVGKLVCNSQPMLKRIYIYIQLHVVVLKLMKLCDTALTHKYL